jgi:murein DD-endopeptidase MepM/ murein hydrolase activator NlpD
MIVACLAASCDPVPPPTYAVTRYDPATSEDPTAPVELAPVAPVAADTSPGRVVSTSTDFAFGGGRIDFEMRQKGSHVSQLARNRYMVPIVMQWQVSELSNLEPTASPRGVVVLPPASAPNGEGPPVELVAFDLVDSSKRYYRHLDFHARWGDPGARPKSYVYGLPYRKQTFSVLQGFHGSFSHRGSNEYAIDFDCPVATPVLAARPGVVVVTNDAAQGSGTTPEFLDYNRTNFVLVLHDDGTLGEYMHLSPSGVEVAPGQKVERGTRLALSGNTGFSSTPHLHFQVMTSGDDGVANRSFPFEIAAGPNRVEEPVQGRSYPAWE